MGRFGDIFNDTRFDFGSFEVKRDFVNEYGDVATLGRGFVSDFNASMDYALGIRNSLYDESDFPTRVDDRPIFDGEDTRRIGYETADAMRRAVHSTTDPVYEDVVDEVVDEVAPQPAPQLATQDVIRNASSTGAEMFNQGFNFNRRPNQRQRRGRDYSWAGWSEAQRDYYLRNKYGDDF